MNKLTWSCSTVDDVEGGNVAEIDICNTLMTLITYSMSLLVVFFVGCNVCCYCVCIRRVVGNIFNNC